MNRPSDHPNQPRRNRRKEYLAMFNANTNHVLDKAVARTLAERQVNMNVSERDANQEAKLAKLNAMLLEVYEIFQSARSVEKDQPENLQNTEEYRRMIRLMRQANLIIPIVAGDWEVNRVEAAERNLGIKGFSFLEQTLSKRYPTKQPKKALEKGGGSYKSLEIRRRANAELPPDQRYEYFGLSTEVMFAIEELLKQFLNPLYQNHPSYQKITDCLGNALRMELKKRWFKVEGSIIRKWTPTVEYFDLNIVFELLKNPAPWLEKWYSPLTGRCKTSREFENDSEESLDPITHNNLLELSGYNPEDREKILIDLELKPTNPRKAILDEKTKQLTKIIKKLQATPPEDVVANFNLWLQRISPLLEKPIDLTYIPRTLEGLVLFLQETAQLFQYEASDLFNHQKHQAQVKARFISSFNSGETAVQRIFSPEFAAAIEGDNPAKLDLNNYAPVFLQNVIIDTFTNIPRYFPSKSLFLINANRSDSHENEKEFRQDISHNLRQLAPGGCLIIDGIRASYSRVMRFEEVLSVLHKTEFKAEIIIDSKTREVKSLFVQRRHPTGFLTPSEKQTFLDEGVELVSLKSISRRPDLRILNHIRRRIQRAAKMNVDYFRRLHKHVSTRVEKVLAHETAKEKFKENEVTPELSQQIYHRIIHGEERVPSHIVETILEKFNSEIDALLREGHVVDDPDTHLQTPLSNTIYTLPNPNADPGLPSINRCYRFSANELGSNQELRDKSFKELINTRLLELRQRIEKLKIQGLRNPVTLVSFDECATNKLLADKLDVITGEIVRHISIRFDASEKGGFSTIKEKPDVIKAINDVIASGGVLVCGGSLHNSNVETFYREIIVGKLLKEILKPDSRLRLFNICFSAQVMADMIGKKYFNNEFKTHPGMLEIGPTPVKLLHAARQHPWLKGFPPLITLATTHTGHIVNQWPHQLISSEGFEVKTLMESNITGLPLTMSAGDGRIISTITHPEIDQVDEKGYLSGDYEKIQDQFEAAGLPYPEIMRRNWQQIRGHKGKSRIVANAGRPLMISGLWHLIHSIPDFSPKKT